MKSPRNTHRPYTVEISAAAWNQVARLSQESYRAIQARLEGVATLGAPALSASTTFQVEDLTVHYVVDPRNRLVTLLEISHERGATPEASSCPMTTRVSG
ncbi:hypothetical protein [Myxococcus qinghaiensis]|uniref:hypothetical protein n=1 Tax=Myxococcus qinghaiensis TaxID=2906758 RepID=UPI0020A73D33|nr:hypothetical protein [Myxococcus qinghaiensis]MCP3161875.1 hypothetical protein [Myxococcus qinghaiensis]